MQQKTKRISKTKDERRDEIVETARHLFVEKGFHATKISDIVREIGVSQGVFYYYFPSKDAVIDALTESYFQTLEARGRSILFQSDLSPLEKLEKLADLQLEVNMREVPRLHTIKGVDIHEKLLRGLVMRFAPLMSEAIAPATKAEPQAVLVEIFLTTGTMLLDPGLFPFAPADRNARIDALIALMEDSLRFNKGDLVFFRRVMRYSP